MNHKENQNLVYHHYISSGLEELRELETGWSLDFRQLERGTLRSEVFQAHVGPILYSETSFSLRLDQRGTPPTNCWTFGFFGEASSKLMWQGKEVPRYSVVLYGPQTPIDAVSWPGFTAKILSVPEEKIPDLFPIAGLPDPRDCFEGGEIIRSDRITVRDIHRCLGGVKRAYLNKVEGGSPVSCEDRVSNLLGHLGTVMQSQVRTHIPRYRVRERAVGRAMEYIEGNMGRKLSVMDLCRVSGVSIRTLEYGFRERFGTTPRAFLKIHRLNNVHRELVRSDPCDTRVTDVANQWNFWHMGDFAADYRKLFDELPSETLRRIK